MFVHTHCAQALRDLWAEIQSQDSFPFVHVGVYFATSLWTYLLEEFAGPRAEERGGQELGTGACDPIPHWLRSAERPRSEKGNGKKEGRKGKEEDKKKNNFEQRKVIGTQHSPAQV